MNGPWVRPTREGVSEAAEREGKAKRVAAGSLLLSFKLTIGRVGFAAVDLFPNEAIACILPATSAIDRRFLALWLGNLDLETYAGRAVKGQTLNSASLRAIPVVLPPLAVQRRIVDLVAAVDAAIHSAEQIKSSAETAALVFFRDWFTLTEAARERLGSVVTFASGYAFPERHQGLKDGPIPYFKVSDMNRSGNEVVLRQAANYVDNKTLNEMRARAWPPGTVVFPKVGAALLTEKRRILGVRAAFDNNVIGLVPGARLVPSFLYWCLRITKLGDFAQHGALPSVNQQHLAEIQIPVPREEEQFTVAGPADGMLLVAERAGTEAAALRRLRSSLLADLLSGNHEIPATYDRFLEDAA